MGRFTPERWTETLAAIDNIERAASWVDEIRLHGWAQTHDSPYPAAAGLLGDEARQAEIDACRHSGRVCELLRDLGDAIARLLLPARSNFMTKAFGAYGLARRGRLETARRHLDFISEVVDVRYDTTPMVADVVQLKAALKIDTEAAVTLLGAYTNPALRGAPGSGGHPRRRPSRVGRRERSQTMEARGKGVAQTERPSFEMWMHTVDVAIQYRAGISVLDLPDCCYRDWYDDEISPDTVANRVLEDAGFDAFVV